MRIVKGDGDTVRFEVIATGEAFYYDKMLFIRLQDTWLNNATITPAGVNLETGVIFHFKHHDQVTPAKAHVAVEATGRVACGYNPR